ncbi:PIN domain-containing protein [Janibacter sp. YIM B02568]|uniref:PIN domain-containing protein n=1 Tax=Janibacter endophyticus TaxID=2806261 RepID=UPI00194F59C0|nr:PIN domain-containing protein [Janibacter endophyticus]MBM6544852.1 PIN domain-containing protein [Janibacter endophyticus]
MRSPERERELRRLLDRFPLLTFDAAADFDAAVSIYRPSRRHGVAPRGLIDCLIAAVALRHAAECLSQDRDLARLAEVVRPRLHPASLGR